MRIFCFISPKVHEEQQILSEEFARLRELRRKCSQSEASLDRDEGIPAEEVFAELEAEYEQRKSK